MLRDRIIANPSPDYLMAEIAGDKIEFTPRGRVIEGGPELPPLSPDTLDAARALAPGMDVYALEQDWRSYWAQSGKPQIKTLNVSRAKHLRSSHDCGRRLILNSRIRICRLRRSYQEHYLKYAALYAVYLNLWLFLLIPC